MFSVSITIFDRGYKFKETNSVQNDPGLALNNHVDNQTYCIGQPFEL